MLTVSVPETRRVTIEHAGGSVTLDVSKSEHMQRGLALYHTPEKATGYIADQLAHALSRFGDVVRGVDGAKPAAAKGKR